MTDRQKDLLREEARANRETATELGGGQPVADVADAIEAALKEVEALGALKLGIKLAAVAGRMSKTLAEDLLVLVETPNEPNEAA